MTRVVAAMGLVLIFISNNHLLSQDFKPINPLEVIRFQPLHLLQDPNGRLELVMQFESVDGFALYTDKVSFMIPATVSRIRTYPPDAIRQFDQTLGQEVEVYQPGHFRLLMQASEPLNEMNVSIKFTACTQDICLFPATWTQTLAVMMSDQDIEDEGFDQAHSEAAARANTIDEGFVPQSSSYRTLVLIASGALSIALGVVSYFYLPKFFSTLLLLLILGNTYLYYSTQELMFEWHLAKNSADVHDQVLSYDFSLIYYGADWCLTCRRMEVMTFKDAELFEELKHFHKIKVDLTESDERFAELSLKDNIEVLPSFVVVHPATSQRKKLEGYHTASGLMQALSSFRKENL